MTSPWLVQDFNICDTWIVLVHHIMMYDNLIFRIYYVDEFIVYCYSSYAKNKQFFVVVTFVFKLPPLLTPQLRVPLPDVSSVSSGPGPGTQFSQKS